MPPLIADSAAFLLLKLILLADAGAVLLLVTSCIFLYVTA